MRLLVAEDQKKIANFIAKGLTEAGYAVDTTDNGQDTFEMIANSEYDLLILDVMLSGDINGFQIAQKVRTDGYHGPILMLTALSTTQNKIQGLDAGADDYLTKPYAFDELLARVRALLRRHSNRTKDTNSKLSYEDLEIDLLTREVKRSESLIALTAKEFTLLEYLMRNAGRPVSRAQIAEHVWDIQYDSDSNVIDVYINMLRKKIETNFARKLIQTLVGVGYVLK